jgi:hypothetical protein
VGSGDIDTRQYGISFVQDEQVGRQVGSSFDLRSYLPGEVGGWQDLAVLQRR